MVILRKSIPRRAFLRGAGATLALPLLDAMTPAQECLVFLPKPTGRPANYACLEGQREFREPMAF